MSNHYGFVHYTCQAIVVSQSREMVDLTLELCAKFYVNGDNACLLQAR